MNPKITAILCSLVLLAAFAPLTLPDSFAEKSITLKPNWTNCNKNKLHGIVQITPDYGTGTMLINIKGVPDEISAKKNGKCVNFNDRQKIKIIVQEQSNDPGKPKRTWRGTIDESHDYTNYTISHLKFKHENSYKFTIKIIFAGEHEKKGTKYFTIDDHKVLNRLIGTKIKNILL